MAFNPWNKNKQIMIDSDPDNGSTSRKSDVEHVNFIKFKSLQDGGSTSRGPINDEKANFININRFKYQQDDGGSTSRGSVVIDEPTNYINMNQLRLFGRNTTLKDPVTPDVDCTLRLGFPPEPPFKLLQPSGATNHYFSTSNQYVVPQAQVMMENYGGMNGRGGTHPYLNNNNIMNHNNRFGLNNNNQIQNRINGNFGFMNGGGDVGGNNFGMFHGNGVGVGVGAGAGGGGPAPPPPVVLALPSPGINPPLMGNNNVFPIPPPPPLPPNHFILPLPNNINPPHPRPPLPPPPGVFIAAPRRNELNPHHYPPPPPPPPPPEPERRCMACDTNRTPLWRNGPKGPKSLCNACGIRYKKEARRVLGMVAEGGHPQQVEAAHMRIRF